MDDFYSPGPSALIPVRVVVLPLQVQRAARRGRHVRVEVVIAIPARRPVLRHQQQRVGVEALQLNFRSEE